MSRHWLPLLPTSNSRIQLSAPRSSGHDIAHRTSGNHRRDAKKDLKVFAHRLHTFSTWPVPGIVSPEKLARAGFYYLQQADAVQCVYCQGIVVKWEPGDDPDRDHRLHFPHCDFYKQQGYDEETGELDNVKIVSGTHVNLKDLGIQTHNAPIHRRHATFESRLQNFQGWPSNLRQTPEMLASAGFYYIGSSDEVRCFHCDGGLRNWEVNDDPWIEHARWFPNCRYVTLVRGQEFVKQCARSRSLKPSVLIGTSEHFDGSRNRLQSNAANSSKKSVNLVPDADLQEILASTPALVAALEIGLNVTRVKMALKRRMEQTGQPYTSANELIKDSMQIQVGGNENLEIPQTVECELIHLLSQITPKTSMAKIDQAKNKLLPEAPDIRLAEKKAKVIPYDESSGEKNEEMNVTISLEEENQMLKEARACKLCMDSEVSVVFLPCGHLATCITCASSLKYCLMCRTEIGATVRTFLA